MGEWILGDLTQRKIGYGIVQPGEHLKNGVPVVKVNNLVSGLRSVSDLATISIDIDNKYNRTRLLGGELIISVVGTIGRTAIVPPNFAGCNLVRAIALIDILNPKKTKWVKYYIDSPKGQHYLKQNLNTTVQPTLNIKSLVEMPIPVYSDKYMSKAVDILSSLDDKIELNNRINANLEEQAQTLFHRWFVDFEFPNEKGFPYKSNGGKFIDSELGRIPEGWTVGNLSTIANIVSGKRPLHKCNIKKGESIIPIIGASSIMGYTTDMLYNEEILIIGRVGTLGVVQRISGPCWTSDNTLVIKSLYKEYIYQLLNRIKYTNINRGSTQPLITQTDMKNTKIFIPDDKILYSFEKLVSQMFACCKENITQNVNIARLRNTLLPKLMNNEI